jgi:hypothetical protein
MLRKIILATLLIGLIGILVAGAVIRTMNRTGVVAEAHGYGRGQGETVNRTEGGLGQGYGWGYREAGAYAATGGAGQGRGGYGQGREDAQGDQMGTGQAHVEEWLTIQGTIARVDADALVVQTDSGEQITMENRPWWFAQEQGFSAQVGDQVALIGFYENGDLEVGQISNATNDQMVLVRDENGRPLWAGRGRRGGWWTHGNTL